MNAPTAAPLFDRLSGQIACVDESYRVVAGGHYVMAAVVKAAPNVPDTLQRLRQVPPRKKGYFHWVNESNALREKMLVTIADTQLAHVVVASTPVGHRRQARARAICLERLMWELHQLEVEHVRLESRGAQDREDKRVIGGIRNRGLVPRSMSFDFGTKQNPELWIPDAIAGAVMVQRCENDDRFVGILGPAGVNVIDIPGVG